MKILGLKKDEIRLELYHAEWKQEFLRIKKNLTDFTLIVGNRIEHIGSTAIEGLAAKPILDIVVGVDDIENVEKDIYWGLKQVGFLRLRVERPNEIVFAKFTDETYEEKTHFIHLVEYNSDLWNNLIFFRDYLNSDRNARQEYEKVKKRFLEEKNGGINEYTDYKGNFVSAIYEKRQEGKRLKGNVGEGF